MTLNDILTKADKSVNDITKIYHGKDNWCRCGCGGNYFEHNNPVDSRGFKRAINTMSKPDFYCFDVDFESIKKGYNFINIPTSDSTPAGTCYCLYFD